MLPTERTAGPTDVPAEAPTGLREAKKARTRASLALAALELAADVGLQATTVEEIAARADVSPRTFFNYFDSKDEAVVHLGTDRLRRLVMSLFSGEAGRDANPVLHIRDAMLDFLGDAEPDAAAQDELLRTALERDASLFAALHTSMATLGAEAEAAITARYDADRDRDLARVGLSVAMGLTQTAMLALRDGRIETPIDAHVARYFDLLASAFR